MELCIGVDSTVNHCHYEDDTTIIRMALSKDIRGLCFYVWFVGKLLTLTGAFSKYNTKCMYFYWIRKRGCSKINPTDQFDHVGVKMDLKWQLGCFNR